MASESRSTGPALEGETPLSIGFDWPELVDVGEKQEAINVAGIKARAKQLGILDFADPQVKVLRFECGYFDKGAGHGDPDAPLQAACTVEYTRTMATADSTVDNFAEVIPAGARVKPDRSWRAANRLAGAPEQPRGEAPASR